MNCEEAFEGLYQYLDKDLDEISMTEIEAHLQSCRHCWSYFEFERKLKERFRTSCGKELLPDKLLQRIKTIFEK